MKILKKKRPAIAICVIVTNCISVSITICLIAQFIRKIENGNINFIIFVFNYIYISI